MSRLVALGGTGVRVGYPSLRTGLLWRLEVSIPFSAGAGRVDVVWSLFGRRRVRPLRLQSILALGWAVVSRNGLRVFRRSIVLLRGRLRMILVACYPFFGDL